MRPSAPDRHFRRRRHPNRGDLSVHLDCYFHLQIQQEHSRDHLYVLVHADDGGDDDDEGEYLSEHQLVLMNYELEVMNCDFDLNYYYYYFDFLVQVIVEYQKQIVEVDSL